MSNLSVQYPLVPIALTAGQQVGNVLFPANFTAVPFMVFAWVTNPAQPNGGVIYIQPFGISAQGFSWVGTGAMPDGTYTLNYAAFALLPGPCGPTEPSCGPCGTGGFPPPWGFPGCGPGQNWTSPPAQPILQYMQGLPGPPGAIAVYAGTYNGANVYYSNAAAVNVVIYGGFFWAAINWAKNNQNTWGVPTTPSADWQNIGPSFTQDFASAIIEAGMISNTVAVYNPADVTRTEPKTAYASFAFGAVANPLPLSPTVGVATDNSLIFYGWLDSIPGLVVNRFANANPVFQVSVAATGENTNTGGHTMTGQLVYATQSNGGGFGAWTPFGIPITTTNQGTGNGQANLSQTAILQLSSLTGVTDVKFGFQYSQNAAGTLISLDAGQISVLCLN